MSRSYDWEIALNEDATRVFDTPLDLTGYLSAGATMDCSGALIVGAATILSPATDGKVQVVFTAAQMAVLTVDGHYWVRIINASNSPHIIAHGRVVIDNE